ncbi:DUF3784 domain-containing protein [Bacillus safensis]|uniref:DUF3784 domain-containing protein n=1 Tax=Bacillus safensis TaxID=561879 RepID=UPI0038186AE7
MLNYLLGGCICIVFSYLIGVKKLLSLIIGYNEFTFLGDKKKLSKRISILLLIIGILTLFMPFMLMMFGSVIKGIYVFIVIVIIFIASALVIIPYFQMK